MILLWLQLDLVMVTDPLWVVCTHFQYALYFGFLSADHYQMTLALQIQVSVLSCGFCSLSKLVKVVI